MKGADDYGWRQYPVRGPIRIDDVSMDDYEAADIMQGLINSLEAKREICAESPKSVYNHPMPAVSQPQQRLMAMAEHNPSAVSKKNRGVLKMSAKALHEYASTPRKGLPKTARKVSMGELMRSKD